MRVRSSSPSQTAARSSVSRSRRPRTSRSRSCRTSSWKPATAGSSRRSAAVTEASGSPVPPPRSPSPTSFGPSRALSPPSAASAPSPSTTTPPPNPQRGVRAASQHPGDPRTRHPRRARRSAPPSRDQEDHQSLGKLGVTAEGMNLTAWSARSARPRRHCQAADPPRMERCAPRTVQPASRRPQRASRAFTEARYLGGLKLQPTTLRATMAKWLTYSLPGAYSSAGERFALHAESSAFFALPRLLGRPHGYADRADRAGSRRVLGCPPALTGTTSRDTTGSIHA